MRMKKKTSLLSLLQFEAVCIPLILSTLSISAHAQAPSTPFGGGWNAIMNVGGTQSSSLGFIDLVAYQSDGRCGANATCDICMAIALALSDSSAASQAGIVIDARGINSLASLTCSGTSTLNGSPFYGNPWSLSSNTLGSTVLLPVGTIIIPETWVPTTDTKITGDGPYSTTIEAVSSGFTGSDVIDMGQEVTGPCLSGSAYNCPDIVIEHLGVNGQGAPDSNDPAHQKIVSGIVNCCSQELGGVDDVYIQQVGIGLEVSDEGAQDSGPYTNIAMSNVGQCVVFQGGSVGVPPGTRGVHGLTCITTGLSANAAIVINTPNNSFEDIYVQGSTSQDGIWVGTQGPAQGNILSNIQGNTLKSVVHLSSATGSATSVAARCPNFATATQLYPNYVCDETIFAVSGAGVTYTIKDDLTAISLTNSNVGMYTVGEAVQGGAKSGSSVPTIGYSRLTTSPSTSPATPTWLFGAALPASCGVGTLFSCTPSDCTSGSSTGTLWECQGGGTWKLIK